MRSKLWTLVVFSTVSISAIAQNSDEEFKKYSDLYPKDNGVFLQRNVNVVITSNRSGGINIIENHFEQRLFLNDNAGRYIEDDIGYSSFSEIEDLTGYVYLPHKSKYKKEKIGEVKEVEEIRGDIFHDDLKKKIFYFKGLSKGGKTELSYVRKLKEPRFLTGFYFESYLPIETTSYSLQTPSHLNITYRLFGDKTDKVEYSKEDKGNVTIHTWTAKNMARSTVESGSVPFRYYATHLQVYINNYQANNKKVDVINDLNDLYRFYYDFVKDVNLEHSDELQRIADSLTQGLETDEEKLKAVFYWVQDNIQYVAIENGLGGFIPRNASLVCSRRYGDCKDMSSITRELLKYAGVKAHLTWIGTRDIPYSYDLVPTPSADNHMISAYHDGEKYIFLDATADWLPYGLPTPFIQGKQALIGIDSNKFELVEVPVVPMEKNKTIDSMFVSVQDMTVVGTGKAEYTGYPSMYVGRHLNNLTEEERGQFIHRAFVKGNNKCQTDLVSIQNLDTREKNLIVEYKFEISDYLRLNGDELYLNPFLSKYESDAKIDTELTKLDRDNHYKESNQYTVVMDVPEGYEIQFMPENAGFNHDKFGFDVTYEVKNNNQIVVDYVFRANYLTLKTSEFEEWNKMIRKMNESYAQLIVFKKKV